MKIKYLGLYILALFLVCSCAKNGIQPISPEDNPAHHYLQGMEMLEKGMIADAEAQFDRATALDPDYARAYAGKALALAMKAEKIQDRDHKSLEIKKALDYLNKALDKAEKAPEKFSVYITAIRIYTHATPKDWLSEAEDFYDKGKEFTSINQQDLIYYQTTSAIDYFMGLAYYRAYKFRKAENCLAKVLSAQPAKWHVPAQKLYAKVQKIVRAMAQFTITDVAKKIAVKAKIGRADVAALLVDELHLDRFMAGRIPSSTTNPKPDFIPADIMNHVFKNEILTVIRWHIRGLEPQYDPTTKAYLFKPDAPLTRKELALILEDLLIKLTGDHSLATKYFGQDHSPFPDVPPTAAWYNAVMNVVSRGLMETDLSGDFRPNDYVDGAELLLSVLRLRNVMNIY